MSCWMSTTIAASTTWSEPVHAAVTDLRVIDQIAAHDHDRARRHLTRRAQLYVGHDLIRRVFENLPAEPDLVVAIRRAAVRLR